MGVMLGIYITVIGFMFIYLRDGFTQAATQLKNVDDSSRNQRDKVKDELKGDIKSVETKLTDKIDTVEAKLTGQINAVETKLTDKIDTVEAKLSDKIDTVETKLTGQINAVETKLTHRIDDIETKLTNKIDTLGANMTTQFTRVDIQIVDLKISSARMSALLELSLIQKGLSFDEINQRVNERLGQNQQSTDTAS